MQYTVSISYMDAIVSGACKSLLDLVRQYFTFWIIILSEKCLSEYKREIVETQRNSNSENMFGSQKCGFLFLMLISMVTAMLDLGALQRALNPTYESNAVFKRKLESSHLISSKMKWNYNGSCEGDLVTWLYNGPFERRPYIWKQF